MPDEGDDNRGNGGAVFFVKNLQGKIQNREEYRRYTF
jgi:hypothetical protein